MSAFLHPSSRSHSAVLHIPPPPPHLLPHCCSLTKLSLHRGCSSRPFPAKIIIITPLQPRCLWPRGRQHSELPPPPPLQGASLLALCSPRPPPSPCRCSAAPPIQDLAQVPGVPPHPRHGDQTALHDLPGEQQSLHPTHAGMGGAPSSAGCCCKEGGGLVGSCCSRPAASRAKGLRCGGLSEL